MATYSVRAEVYVTVEVDDDYADEWGGLLDPQRQEGIYDLENRDEMLRHLAFNCVANGQEDASRLDGWAGIPEEHLSMHIDRHSTWMDWWDVEEVEAAGA